MWDILNVVMLLLIKAAHMIDGCVPIPLITGTNSNRTIGDSNYCKQKKVFAI